MMPLSSVFFRGGDSNGKVIVCSTFPSCRFSLAHAGVQEQGCPVFSTDSLKGKCQAAMAARAGLGTSVLPRTRLGL